MDLDINKIPAQEIAAIVQKAFRDYTNDIEMMLVNGFSPDQARQNDKRPAWITFFCPDEWAKNFRGYNKFQDLYVVIRIPAEIVEDELEEKKLGTTREGDTREDDAVRTGHNEPGDEGRDSSLVDPYSR